MRKKLLNIKNLTIKIKTWKNSFKVKLSQSLDPEETIEINQ